LIADGKSEDVFQADAFTGSDFDTSGGNNFTEPEKKVLCGVIP
jgi:hypothetical protein